ncbi:MAG: PAS domain S-box protein [Deltaproteobacteria bacterium]|nr:PAS domain S-box protein [Deltaproteobacteria bacterium]
MDKTLRILMLEDNPADTELIQFELSEARIDFAAKVVMTEEDFVHGLQTFSPDVILSDYDLPRYTGALALAEAKKRCPDVPFILVTGAVSEDRAIEILTSGAKDYVMKSRLNRVVPAVRRALEEAEEHRARKKAEEEVRAASLYSRTLIEASLDPLVTISPDGKVMDVNKATEEATGVPRDQMIGTDFADYFTEPERARAGYEKAFSNGSVKDYPLALRHVSGEITDVLYNATTYANEEGEVKGVFAAARDVTELKRKETELWEAHRDLEEQVQKRTAALEFEIVERMAVEKALRESERRERERAVELEALLDAAPTPVFIAHDPDARHLTGNRAADDLLKMPPGSETSLSAPAEVRPRHFRAMKDGRVLGNEELPAQRAARGIQVRDFDFSLVFDDGTIRHVLGYGTPLRDEKGEPRGAVHVLVDITERKLAEEALRESKERYRELVSNANSIIIRMDRTGTITFFNLYAQKFFGYALEEILGKNVRILLPPSRDNGKRLTDMMDNILKSPDDFEENYNENVRKNGESVWILWRNRAIRDRDGNIVGTLSIGNDMTERRRAEEALQESRERLRYALEISHTGAWDLNLRDHRASRSLEHDRIFGYKELLPEWTYEMFLDHVLPEDRGEVDARFREAAETGKDWNFDCRIRRADGEVRWIWASGSHRRGADGKPLWLTGIVQDITERKRAEEELRKKARATQTLG